MKRPICTHIGLGFTGKISSGEVDNLRDICKYTPGQIPAFGEWAFKDEPITRKDCFHTFPNRIQNNRLRKNVVLIQCSRRFRYWLARGPVAPRRHKRPDKDVLGRHLFVDFFIIVTSL